MIGSTDRIFSFGMSGGAQSALLGSTGDSELYTPYLEAIKVADASDAIAGSMCWSPITNLDMADAAYEWNMGCTRSDLSDSDQKISDDLAKAYASYINKLDLKVNGATLTLEKSSSGIYQSGSYYNYLKKVIETSLTNFLNDTEFSYTPSSSGPGSSSTTYNSVEEYLESLKAIPHGLLIKIRKPPSQVFQPL